MWLSQMGVTMPGLALASRFRSSLTVTTGGQCKCIALMRTFNIVHPNQHAACPTTICLQETLPGLHANGFCRIADHCCFLLDRRDALSQLLQLGVFILQLLSHHGQVLLQMYACAAHTCCCRQFGLLLCLLCLQILQPSFALLRCMPWETV